MNPIYALWATPRSTSTAFEWMMRMRGDLACFHEPHGEAWYQGDDALAPRMTADSPRKPGLNFTVVQQRLVAAARKRPVFIKDMPQFTEHLWSEDFLARFEHSFLIRDPARVLLSLHRSWVKSGNEAGFTRTEIGFAAQRRLFDILHERDARAPVVIDSDDLLADPPAMVKRYCDAIGIPFIAAALRWEPGARNEVLWYDGDDTIWHETLKNSDGLQAQRRDPVDVVTLPAKLQDYRADFIPHYRHLYRHRLRP